MVVFLGKYMIPYVPPSSRYLMCHTASGFYTGSLQFPQIANLVLSPQSCVTPPNLKNRRYMFQRMSCRTHLTSNSLQMFMTNRRTSSPRLSLTITATLILTAVPLLLVNHSRQRFRRNTRERTAIPTLPAPLMTSSIPMTAIITIIIMAKIMIATMVTITTILERCPPPNGVHHLIHP